MTSPLEPLMTILVEGVRTAVIILEEAVKAAPEGDTTVDWPYLTTLSGRCREKMDAFDTDGDMDHLKDMTELITRATAYITGAA